MKYKALVSFLHDELGAVKAGQEVEATNIQATTPLLLGYLEPQQQAEDEPQKRIRKAK